MDKTEFYQMKGEDGKKEYFICPWGHTGFRRSFLSNPYIDKSLNPFCSPER